MYNTVSEFVITILKFELIT